MALSPIMMKELMTILKPGMRVASFGYPDIIGDTSVILSGKTPEYRQDSAAICQRHGIDYRLIPDANSFFKVLGATLWVFDIVQERGNEIFVDLNEPETPLISDFDIVLDVGTAEHCFNIGQAARNMMQYIKVGGYILHENPFNWGNHGFYGLQPTWYVDFYEQNGFKVEKLYFVMRDGTVEHAIPTKRFKFNRSVEANVFAQVRRAELVDFKWPVQTKYKHLIKG